MRYILFIVTSTPAPSPNQTPPGTPPNELEDDTSDIFTPDLVKENRAKGVLLRSYRVEDDSVNVTPTKGEYISRRRNYPRAAKRARQELDTQGLMSRLSRLVQWPFQGYTAADGNSQSMELCHAAVTRMSTTMSGKKASYITTIFNWLDYEAKCSHRVQTRV